MKEVKNAFSISPLWELVGQRCSEEKFFWRSSQKSQENTCDSVHGLAKLLAERLQLFFKKDSIADVFLQTLRKF